MLLLLLALLLPARIAFAQTAVNQPIQNVNDVFAFSSNEDQQRIILAFTADDLRSDLLYQFNIDTNRDRVEDRVVQLTLKDTAEQKVFFAGPSVPERTGQTISPVKTDNRLSGTLSVHANPQVLTERGSSMRAFAGLRNNPRTGQPDSSNVYFAAVELPLDAILAENKPDFDFWISVYKKDE